MDGELCYVSGCGRLAQKTLTDLEYRLLTTILDSTSASSIKQSYLAQPFSFIEGREEYNQ